MSTHNQVILKDIRIVMEINMKIKKRSKIKTRNRNQIILMKIINFKIIMRNSRINIKMMGILKKKNKTKRINMKINLMNKIAKNKRYYSQKIMRISQA